MKYRELGNTGLKISEIGFGAEWMTGAPEQTWEMMHNAHHGGVNVFDCWMSDPHIRENLGFGLNGHRDHWIIQAHVGSCWVDGQYVRSRDLDLVVPAFEDEMRLLGTEHFEIGMLHYIDDLEEFNESMNGRFFDYVLSLKDRGVIDHIGLSTHNPHVALAAIDTGQIETLMFSINPAFDIMPPSNDINVLFGDLTEGGDGIDPVRALLYAKCEQEGVGLTVMKPFAGGRMLDARKSPFGIALTPAQCIHYCLTRPGVSSVMAGWKNLDELFASLAYYDSTAEELDYASKLAGAKAHAYFGQCTYCGHCQPCPMEIDIATVNKFADLAAMHDEVPTSVRMHYQALEKNASDCIGCRTCEQNCPFGVAIAERMEQTATLFA